jgi:hypothetical protein
MLKKIIRQAFVIKLQLPMNAKRPPKAENFLETVHQHVLADRYLDTRHATDRKNERNILRAEIRAVLLAGRHEKSRDRYDELLGRWSYSVRGCTVDLRELRIIVALDETGTLIISAIELAPTGESHGNKNP